MRLVLAKVKPAASTRAVKLVAAREHGQRASTSVKITVTRFRADTISAKHILFEDGGYYYQQRFHVIRNTPNNLLKMILTGWDSKYACFPAPPKDSLSQTSLRS